MITQAQIIEQGQKFGFEDVGFTSAAPFHDHKKLLLEMTDEYGWADEVGLDLKNGVDPASILPKAKTIIVLIEPYFNKSYPSSMEAHFGRCYLDDDRVKGMIAWAMGQIGNQDTGQILKSYSANNSGKVLKEILMAIQTIAYKNRNKNKR